MLRGDLRPRRVRQQRAVASSVALGSTLGLESLFQAVAGRALGRPVTTGLRGARWLLPWLVALLVSASLASAATSALNRAWAPIGPSSASSVTPAVAALPPAGAVGNSDDARALDLVCISRFATYTALSDAVRRCSTLAGTSPTTPPDEPGDAHCELIIGQPLYAGQNTWIAQQYWQCAGPPPELRHV
jgi:hypothetical protein